MEIIQEKKCFHQFYSLTADIINSSKFQTLKNQRHHGNELGRFAHCVRVAYYAYVITKKLHLDSTSTARGALLHDYYFEDWRKIEHHEKGLDRIRNMHAVAHPKRALKNAEADYHLNKKEENMILRHMFPVTITPPRYAESWIVSLVDKGVAAYEFAQSFRRTQFHHASQAMNNV
jgi:uncharacterized protein